MTAERKKALMLNVLIALFLIAFAYCLPKTGDDWLVTPAPGSGGLIPFVREMQTRIWNTSDGRILGNLLTNLNVNLPAARIVFFAAAMTLLFALSARLTQFGERRYWWVCLPLLFVFLSPAAWFAGDIAWTYGFTVYVPPFVLTLACLCMQRDLFFDRPIADPWWTCLLCAVLGFAGQLFSEVSTLYVTLMSLALCVWQLIRFKRISLTSICYFIGATAGLAVMFRSPAYRIFAASEITPYVYSRSIATDLEQIVKTFRTVYEQVSAYSLGMNTLPTALISVCGIALLSRSGGKRRALSVVASVILAAAPVYFFFTARDLVIPDELVTLLPMGELLGNDWYAIALDMLVYALYMLSVAAALLLGASSSATKRFGLFLLLSFLCCTAPQCLTYPISHRVFFSAYMFLVLLGLVLLNDLIASRPVRCGAAVTAVLAATFAVCAVYMAMFGTNPRVERQKLSYIERCMARGDTEIVLPQFLFQNRLYLPEGSFYGIFHYETPDDITFTYLPYEQWLTQVYAPDAATQSGVEETSYGS